MSDGDDRAKLTQQQVDEIYAGYRDERNKLIDGQHDHSRSYQKYLLTLSGGALGLSLTVVADFASKGTVESPGLFLSAWLGLGVAIAAAMVALHQAQYAFEDYRRELDDAAQKGIDRDLLTRTRERQAALRRPKLISCLDYVSLVAFLFGIVCLFCFAQANLS